MGWLRDQPDIRDYWIEIGKPASRQTKKTSSKKGRLSGKSELKLETTPSPTLSSVADSVGKLKFPYPPPAKHLANVKWCSPVEDQGALGSCTAQAGVGLFEYYQRRFSGTHVDGSRRFVYKATRNLLGWTGDTGAYCRTTMATIALLGVALEDYWPYTVADPDFDEEPPAFVYALAENYKGLIYHRIDAMGASLPTLTRIKILISVGWPAMFGFTCYESLFDSPVGQTGEIPWPVSGERRVGGHAVVAVGYDDNKKISNNRIGGVETTGAFLIRNSWGTNWGVIPPSAPAGTSRGYGWLPYKYLEQGQATDWWSLTKAEWIPTEGFSL
jgi:C1A family cysteine protease